MSTKSGAADQPSSEIASDDFVRRFTMRPGQLMWLLGAGASAAAGIPTASDMTWEFKQRLFVSQRGVSMKSVENLASPAIRARLQDYIDTAGRFPNPNAPDEYAALFEAVYPSEIDRQSYIKAKIAGAKPSYGHLALGCLMKAAVTRIVWTTNFDPLIADSCAMAYESTGALTTVDLGDPERARQCIDSGAYPLEVKLHGDFRSRRLKNTGDELREQDQKLRRILVDCCRRFGLVIAGYSGRDTSIMDALHEALKESGAFPLGLFWLHRGDDPPLDSVRRLIKAAAAQNIETGIIRIENFDEVARDIARQSAGIDTKLLDAFTAQRRYWSAAPHPQGRPGQTTIRLNAIPILEIPSVCRRVVAGVGGHAAIRAMIEQAGVDILFARVKSGVLAYGTDADVRSVFSSVKVDEFSLHSIEEKRLRYDSGERGLLAAALARGLGRHRGMRVVRRRARFVLAPLDPDSDKWKPLRKIVGPVSGTLQRHAGVRWSEAIDIGLEWAANQLWLLFDPQTHFFNLPAESRGAAADFSRERSARRYNRQLNDLLGFWADLLAGECDEIRAFGLGSGVDAVFKLARETAFSERIVA